MVNVSFDQKTRPDISFKTRDRAFQTLSRDFKNSVEELKNSIVCLCYNTFHAVPITTVGIWSISHFRQARCWMNHSKKYVILFQECLNSLTTIAFALQINWLVSMWWGTLVFNGLTQNSYENLNFKKMELKPEHPEDW